MKTKILQLFAISAALFAFVSARASDADNDANDDVKSASAAEKKPSPSLVQIKDEPGLPRVLLIGDSVSQGYTLQVRALLKGKANVHRPPTNCGSTTSGIAHIDDWLGDKKWDIIHFNWGLHDLKYLQSGHQNVTPEKYEKNLTELVTKMKKKATTLIFATTTPIPEKQRGIFPRNQGDIAKYNEIALRVMKANGVLIDDLYAAVAPNIAECQIPNDVHFNKKGCDVLAKAVAASIGKVLPEIATATAPTPTAKSCDTCKDDGKCEKAK